MRPPDTRKCTASAAFLPISPGRKTQLSLRPDTGPRVEEGERADLATTIGIIQARMGSDRLPGKILAPLSGRPVLGLIADRLRNARVDEWWLATSDHPADDVTEAWGFELGLRVFRGHPTEVLSRLVAIGEETGADWLVRATAKKTDGKVKPSVVKSRVGLATAVLGTSLSAALPALADDGGGGGGAIGIVALIAVAGAAFVAGQGSGGGGGGDDRDDDPPPPTGSKDSKNFAKNLTIASDVQRKSRKPPKPKNL